MIQIKLVLICFIQLRRQIAIAAQQQPSSIVTGTNMGWQHDARNAGPIQGIRFLDAEMGLLAIWVDIQHWLSIRPTFRRLGRAHGANLRPELTVREGPR